MLLEHPRETDETNSPSTVDVNGDRVPVADDGTFEVPDSATGWVERFATRYDATVDELLVDQSETVPFDPREYNVKELVKKLHEVNDLETLRALKNIEQEQDDRKTAVEAINDRLADVEE